MREGEKQRLREENVYTFLSWLSGVQLLFLSRASPLDTSYTRIYLNLTDSIQSTNNCVAKDTANGDISFLYTI